jgi:hypothetical protein
MANEPKKAKELTTDEVMDRVFGKGAAEKLRAVVEQADAEKGKRHPKTKKPKENQP